MIFNSNLNTLTEEELALLLLILNEYPKSSQFEVDFSRAKCYKLNHVAGKLEYARNKIKPEFVEMLDGIKLKLEIK